MTGVMIRKVQMIAPDAVIQIVSHGRLVLRKMQNASTAKKLVILRKFVSLQTKVVRQSSKKAGKKEVGSRTHP